VLIDEAHRLTDALGWPMLDLSNRQLSLERIVRRGKYTASENVDGAT
jgi:hypothetical protein